MTPLGDVLDRKQWTQMKLAREAGVCRTTVWAAVKGERPVSPESYLRMARALGVAAADISPEAAELIDGVV